MDAFWKDYVFTRACQVSLLALGCAACGSAAPRAVTPSTVVAAPENPPTVEDGEPETAGAPPEPERKEGSCRANTDAATTAQAKKLFEEGVELYERGEYGAAASAFKESYELSCTPILLFNIARAYEQLGDIEGAIATLERLLREVEPNDAIIETVRRRLEDLRTRR